MFKIKDSTISSFNNAKWSRLRNEELFMGYMSRLVVEQNETLFSGKGAPEDKYIFFKKMVGFLNPAKTVIVFQ